MERRHQAAQERMEAAVESTGLWRQAAVGRRKPQPRKGVLVLHQLQHIKDASVAVLQQRQRMHMHTGNLNP